MMNRKMVLRVVSKLLIPIIMLFGLYVQFHGDFGPGGGFQAGVIFASAFILYALIYGVDAARKVCPPAVSRFILAFGLILYAAVGFWAIAGGGNYLDYDFLFTDPLTGQHYGILIIELGVGLTVTAAMITIFFTFAGRDR